MAYDVNTTYALDPWDNLTLDEREWYDGFLREIYSREAVYSKFVTLQVDLSAFRTRTIHFNDLIPPRPNIAAINARTMDANRLYTDSLQKELTVARYGNGMSIHRESELFNYWQQNGSFGLVPILRRHLGQVIVDHIDMLARNAFVTNPFALYGLTAGASGFSDITTSDTISTELLDEINLGMRERRKITEAFPTAKQPGNMFCITTPGVYHDLLREQDTTANSNDAFVDISLYQGGTNLMRGEVGLYRNFRFVINPNASLYACGELDTQTTIDAAVSLGDGAPDPETTTVDGVYQVGQPGATHYIQVADVTGFAVNDIVKVHKTRGTSLVPLEVIDGAQYNDPMAQDMQIHSIDTGNDRLTFTTPYMMVDTDSTGLETDLGGGVYGYVTKARHVNTALFLDASDPSGLIAGFAQPPRIYTPPAIDDYMSMFRITYDFWSEYALWNPGAFEIAFLAGSHKTKGRAVIT
jgi:N4-gp56 family major capsid protein